MAELDDAKEEARQRLVDAAGLEAKSREDLLALYKQFLRLENERIHLRHHAGATGLEVARRRSNLLDVVLESLFQQALIKNLGEAMGEATAPVTMVATGGYGRQLLNPSSDIDIQFLYPSKREPSPEAHEIIEQILYMLWDVGFKVGHAVRSVKDTIIQANADVRTKSSLIEARMIAGDKDLFERVQREFKQHCITGKEHDYLTTRRRDMRERRDQYDTVFVQEPNVKSGCGGLRDYHNLIWISFVHCGSTSLDILVKKRVLTKEELEEIERAYDFLHRVRNELHYQAGRDNDILTLQQQGVVATNFKYPSRNILRRIETFMREYYHATRSLYRCTWKLLEKLHLAHEEEGESGVISLLARRRKKREFFGNFYSWNQRIYPASDDIFEEEPYRLMRVFQHLQQRHLRLSPEIMERISASDHLLNREFRYNKKVRTIFEAILSRRGNVARVLKDMHRVGMLGKYLPEFGALDCLVQHEFFHRYTADHHTLQCIRQLDKLADTQEPKVAFFRDLFRKVEDPYILYLAFILHDTGRAENVRFHSDASTTMAERVCRRLQVKGHRRDLMLFLVDHHLTFWKTATTMPIDDPDTVIAFATQMRDKRHLDLLLLFTYADSKGTNEEGWTDWKEMLMKQLYHATLAYWSDQGALEGSTPDFKAEVLKHLKEGYEDEVETHFDGMPKRYFFFRSAQSTSRDIRLIRKFYQTDRKDPTVKLDRPVFRWIDHPEANYSQFIVCSYDCEQLLACIAGVLSAKELNILSADFFRRKDGIVLDIFRVCTLNLEAVTNTSVRKSVKTLMETAMAKKHYDFSDLIEKTRLENPIDHEAAAVFPQRVFINNRAAADETVIEIQALDRLGLLYDCFMVIADHGLQITHSRIITEKGAAIDSIFVTNAAGEKIEDEEKLAALKRDLQRVLELPVPAEKAS
ncbi:MAG: [protein-PII] uridylyltransferase [Verrucomicrobiales bacterium]|jgi:[protein-PII] uridylyltransferase|nr:[protein-PII] uridylyltransferase [Verrucomicrobiales bacterium]